MLPLGYYRFPTFCLQKLLNGYSVCFVTFQFCLFMCSGRLTTLQTSFTLWWNWCSHQVSTIASGTCNPFCYYCRFKVKIFEGIIYIPVGLCHTCCLAVEEVMQTLEAAMDNPFCFIWAIYMCGSVYAVIMILYIYCLTYSQTSIILPLY